MMRGLSALLMVLLCGCATVPSVEWTKLGAVRGQVEVDIFACERWSSWGTPGHVDQEDFQNCMVATGWTLAAPSGNPPNDILAAR